MKENNNANDAKGKLNELLLAKVLNGDRFPNHFRQDTDSPENIFEACVNTVGEDTYIRISDDVKEMSTEVFAVLVQDQWMVNTTDVQSVWWTSNEDSIGAMGDHEKLTGIKDLNSDADMIIQTISSNTFIGISCKYGSSKNITLRNPGKKFLEAKLSLTDLDVHKIEHDKFIEELGFNGSSVQNHEDFKLEKTSSRSLKAIESNLKYRKLIANDIRNALHAKGSYFIRDFIRDLISPETVFEHYRTQTHTKQSISNHYVHNMIEYSNKVLSKYDNFHVNLNQNSTVINIYARLIDRNEVEVVASLSIKSRSGPMTNWNGVLTAPMLSPRKRKKKVLYAFDMDDTLFWYHEHLSPKIRVYNEDTLIHELSPSQYNSYYLNEGERFYYGEFESSELFSKIANPIQKMIDKMNSLVNKGKKVEIVTARQDFDNKELFLETLNRYGIDTNKVHITRVGNRKHSHETTAMAKKAVFVDMIHKEGYDEIHFYDDNRNNLDAFMSLEFDFPDVKLIAYLTHYNIEKHKFKCKKVDRKNVFLDN